MSKFEVRKHDSSFNSPDDSRRVEGRAIVFETPSNDLGGFVEIIHRGAVTQELVSKSDVYARTNHSDDYIMARSNKGKGSLSLELREDGLYYSFDAPNTEKGNELLEHLRRGEISQSSFAFSVAKERGAEVWEKKDGVTYRHIYKIGYLGDVAPVFSPAYEETSVCLRALDLAKNLSGFSDFAPIETRAEDLKDEEESKEENDEPKPDNEEGSGEEPSTPLKDNEQENNSLEPQHKNEEGEGSKEEDNEEPQPKEEPKDNEENNPQPKNEEEDRNININIKTENKTMEKRFSLLGAINSIANNQQLDAISSAVVSKGQNEMRKAGLSYAGQLQLPTEDLRATISVGSEGEDTVATELFNVLEPLRAKNVLVQAGAKFLTGLQSDVLVPLMSKSNVTWEGETASAKDGAGTFSNVKFSPKRLTAYIDISKQFLIQESVGAEAMIRQDIVNAINTKLEETIFGEAAGTATQPAGMFYGKTKSVITSFANICDLEATIEDANITGECKYIMSNKAKASLRNMAKSTKTNQLVMEMGTIDGTPVFNTSNVGDKSIIYGDWSQYCICQWGGIDLLTDPYTKAAEGMVRLVINAYFDAKPLRDVAFAYATTQTA